MTAKKWTDAMVTEIYRRRLAGERFADMAREFKVSGQRVRQLHIKGKWRDIAAWKMANGWKVERPGGRWIDPPMPWPEYPGPGWR